MSYCLSPHDRDVLVRACEARDWGAVRTLLRIDSVRHARVQDDGWAPAERRAAEKFDAPFDRERDEGDAA